ncbi:hypothetical protein ABK040_013585 [Willaertia magna]
MSLIKISESPYKFWFEEQDKKIDFDFKIKFLDYGLNHIVIVTDCNEIYVFGSNKTGALGLGHNADVTEFTKVESEEFSFGNIKILECGNDFTIIVNDLNEVFFAGNYNNILYLDFIKIDLNVNLHIKNIKFFNNNLLIFTKQNEIYNFKKYKEIKSRFPKKEIEPTSDQLLLLDNSLEMKDVQCGLLHCVVLDNSGDIYGFGENNVNQLDQLEVQVKKFTKIDLSFKVKEIKCSDDATLLLNEFNELFVCGNNDYNQLGINSLNEGIKTIEKFTKVKILNNAIVNSIFKTFKNYNVIQINNNYFVSGPNQILQLNVGNDFFVMDAWYSDYTICFLEKCSKLEGKYNYPVLLEGGLFTFVSDYEINRVEEGNVIGENCLQKVNSKQLSDVSIIKTN